MSRGATLNRLGLIAEVARLAGERATGTLFVRTVDAHTARFVLREGELVGIAYRTTRGPAAIPMLQTIGDCSLEFTPGFVFPVSSSDALPPTAVVLDVLRNGGGPSVDDIARDATIEAALEALLTEFIGSFAAHVMNEISNGTRESRVDWQAAVDRMASEVDAGQVGEFIKRARKLVGR